PHRSAHPNAYQAPAKRLCENLRRPDRKAQNKIPDQSCLAQTACAPILLPFASCQRLAWLGKKNAGKCRIEAAPVQCNSAAIHAVKMPSRRNKRIKRIFYRTKMPEQPRTTIPSLKVVRLDLVAQLRHLSKQLLVALRLTHCS